MRVVPVLLCGILAACSAPDEGGDIDPEATVEVPTGEVGPAPPLPGDSLPVVADSAALSFPDSTAVSH